MIDFQTSMEPSFVMLGRNVYENQSVQVAVVCCILHEFSGAERCAGVVRKVLDGLRHQLFEFVVVCEICTTWVLFCHG